MILEYICVKQCISLSSKLARIHKFYLVSQDNAFTHSPSSNHSVFLTRLIINHDYIHI